MTTRNPTDMGPDLASIEIGGEIPYSHIIRLGKYMNDAEFTRHRERLTTLCAGKTVPEYGVPCGPESEHHIYNIGKFKGYCGYFTKEIIDELRTWEEVDGIKPNTVCGLLSGGSSGESNLSFRPPRQLAESVTNSAIEHPDADLTAGPNADPNALPGAGVDIYVIDSGILTSHTLFGKRASFGVNIADHVDNDDLGHGTQVAGVAGADELGVAKGAKLIAVKVIGQKGRAGEGNLIGGIGWSFIQAMKESRPAVFVISLGVTAGGWVDDVVANVFDMGYLCCVAAGNGPIGSKFGTPGIDAGAVSPAREPKAFTVGAGEWGRRGPYRCRFSNYGSCLALFADGNHVVTCGNKDNDDRGETGGTSFACPRAAGVAAILLSKIPVLRKDPQALTDAIKAQAYNNMVGLEQGSPNLFL